jgi:DNA adenine methylase
MTPILKYPGAKWRLASWIIENMPEHESYLEPFFGSGAVFFSKHPARIETINDTDGAVVHFFRVCRERPDELAEAIRLTPWSREEYQNADFRNETIDDVERARQFAVRCWMAFGGRLDVKTGWRHTIAKYKDGGPDNPKLWARMPDVIRCASQRLLEAQIENRPALEVIKAYAGPNVLIYADPPYLKGTRTLHGDQYRHEMSDQDHIDLLEALKAHPGPVLISGYPCDLYENMLYDWRYVTSDARAECGAVRTECLWIKEAKLQDVVVAVPVAVSQKDGNHGNR